MNRLIFPASLVVLFTASVAMACATCSLNNFKCTPGFWLLGFEAAVPMYTLAAFIERPFLSKAGVTSNTIWHSLLATLLTMVTIGVAGVVVLFVGFELPPLMLVWLPGSVLLSAWVKRCFLGRRTLPWSESLRLGPFLTGALASHVTILLLPALQAAFGFDTASHYNAILHLKLPAAILSLIGGAVLVSIAFRRTLGDRIDPQPRSGPRGFEVLGVQSSRRVD